MFLQEAGYPSLSFNSTKSYAVKLVPRRKAEKAQAFGLPAYPVFLRVAALDPKKAVQAIRKMMSEVPAAYVVNYAAFGELTKAPGVITKDIVSPTAWPALEEKESDSEDDEHKNCFYLK